MDATLWLLQEVSPTTLLGEEDPTVLQALADELMGVYHSVDLARQA